MATVYLPDGGSYDDGQQDYLDRSSPTTGTRGTDAPTLSTMPVPSPAAPQPSAWNPMEYLDKLSGFRTAAEGARMYEDQTDTNILNTDRFRTFVQSGQYLPSGDAWPDAQGPGGNFGQNNGGDARVATSTPLQPPLSHVPFQFNDPYTKQLEELGQRALQSFTQPNPQVQQVMDFLNKRFGELSTSNGYSPDELAVLRTQALEPIEANRQASQKRVMERAGARGMLPSSGLIQDEQRTVDRDFDKLRTAADRDLAINSINERGRRQGEALNLGQLGISIPQQQNAQALNVGQMLYNLPRQAMLDAQGVINGSAPQNMISPYVQLLQQQQNADAIRRQQDADYYDSLTQQILNIFK